MCSVRPYMILVINDLKLHDRNIQIYAIIYKMFTAFNKRLLLKLYST